MKQFSLIVGPLGVRVAPGTDAPKLREGEVVLTNPDLTPVKGFQPHHWEVSGDSLRVKLPAPAPTKIFWKQHCISALAGATVYLLLRLYV